MPWVKGLDFRANNSDSGYANIDPADCTYTYIGGSGAGEWYPTTRNALTFGWKSPGAGGWRNRSTTNDPRLAGVGYATAGFPLSFIIDLPQAGQYDLDLSAGDPNGGAHELYFNIYDGDGVSNTLLTTLGPTSIASGQFKDAAWTTFANAAAWVAGHATIRLTFSTTKFHLTLEQSLSGLNHIKLTLVEGEGGGSTVPVFVHHLKQQGIS